ncbi:hypothetical protein FIBSPDRAFT_927521 [Athelia psychrophila]|uniref:Uncharacterized protein n=1 Tax=Athelia psychrophila TaxID=1759441 RepID=A0A166RK82_9AGAM|nr:hypothetical protein FIBSPDRAFT_927521 [Fibularhizoctonia sp. CBS 109695]
MAREFGGRAAGTVAIWLRTHLFQLSDFLENGTNNLKNDATAGVIIISTPSSLLHRTTGQLRPPPFLLAPPLLAGAPFPLPFRPPPGNSSAGASFRRMAYMDLPFFQYIHAETAREPSSQLQAHSARLRNHPTRSMLLSQRRMPLDPRLTRRDPSYAAFHWETCLLATLEHLVFWDGCPRHLMGAVLGLTRFVCARTPPRSIGAGNLAQGTQQMRPWLHATSSRSSAQSSTSRGCASGRARARGAPHREGAAAAGRGHAHCGSAGSVHLRVVARRFHAA